MTRKFTARKKILATTLVAVFTSALASQASFAATVDVLVIYNNETYNHYDGSPETAITNMVATANTYFDRSNIDVQLNLVGPIRVEIPHAQETLSGVRSFPAVETLRNALNPDITTYLAGSPISGSIAWKSTSDANAINIVDNDSINTTFIHEVGHNFGLGHSLLQNSTGSDYDYGIGYGVEGEMSTIMAYSSSYDSPGRTFLFSSPTYRCEGYTCGVSNRADARRAINNVASRVADHRDRALFVSMRKKNAFSYALDGNAGGVNRQEPHLWRYNASQLNPHFEQISRGNDYFSFRKRNTNHCLDGGNGGENGQVIILWECGDNNQNQQWKKIKVGPKVDGLWTYRLEKRNASGYSIDGGNGGAKGQGLILYRSDDSNKNQQWTFKRES